MVELFPHLAAAFLVAACTKHARTVAQSGFPHICLALNCARDRSLDGRWGWALPSQYQSWCHNQKNDRFLLRFRFVKVFQWNMWKGKTPIITLIWSHIDCQAVNIARERIRQTSTSLRPSEVKFVSVKPQPAKDQSKERQDKVWARVRRDLPATFPSKPAKLCPSEGRQTGGKSSRLTCSPEQHRCCCFGSLIYGWIKFLLVFRRAMSLTCLVKLKSLWRTTSVTWSSLVVVRMW